MEKFFNDLQTFVANMDSLLKLVLIVLFALIDILIFRGFIKKTNKDKGPRIKIVNVLLVVICTGAIILLTAYSF